MLEYTVIQELVLSCEFSDFAEVTGLPVRAITKMGQALASIRRSFPRGALTW